MGHDFTWFVQTCHACQIQQTKQILILPIVATLALLFAKMYIDTMHMPRASRYFYIVQGCCSLMHYPEFQCLRKETPQAIRDWIFQDVLFHWGTQVEIVSDNRKPFVTALQYIETKYHVKHIRISSYNLHANRIIERAHYDIREALLKALIGLEGRWVQATHSVFWSE